MNSGPNSGPGPRSGPGPLRCFVAVELDAAARREMARVEDLLRRSEADVKWVAPGSLHLTLKFLGEVPVPGVPKVTQSLQAALGPPSGASASPGRFDLKLTGVGAFPSLSNPRVVWVGVTKGKETLTALAARVEAALEPLGFPREGRPFSPHLTLGRCWSPRNAAAFADAMSALRAYEGPVIAVERVVLFSSDLRPTGPVYTSLATFPL